MATVILPRSLIALFPGAERRVMLEGPASVRELIDALDLCWPGVRDRLCDAGPSIRDYVNIFVDGEPAELDTPLARDSTVHVLPAVAGGRSAGA